MPAKVTVKFSSGKDILKMQKEFIRLAPKVYEKAILGQIAKGKSPVKGGRWDKPYSKSYRDAISTGAFGTFQKKTSPVNLKLSGQLLESLDITRTRNSLSITFDDPLADVHNRRGTRFGKKIRRMLPTISGEDFNKTITTKIDLLLRRVVKRNITKQNGVDYA